MDFNKTGPYSNFSMPFYKLGLGIGLCIIAPGLLIGFLAGTVPILLIAGFIGCFILLCFFANFERTVIGLLVLRSSVDLFADQQLPALLGVGLIFLTLLYVIVQKLMGQKIYTDQFWWIFAGWTMLQAVWVILLAVGGLGLDASFLFNSIREWLRFFSFLMVYLLVMQLKDRLSPEELIDKLMLALIVPLTVAFIQLVVPHSFLPSMFVPRGDGLEEGSRISGSFDHSAQFAKFLFLFLSITYWKTEHVRKRLPWILLLVVLAFFLTAAKSLTVFIMVFILLLFLVVPKLKLSTLVSGVLISALMFSLFATTEYGQERISSVFQTPLLNSEISASRAILMQNQPEQGNSFNWRILYWTQLLKGAQRAPILGHGLGNTKILGDGSLIAHNDYIGSYVETGFVGLVIFISFLSAQLLYTVYLMARSPKGSAQKSFCLMLIAVQLSLAVGMSVDNIWRATGMFTYWWACMAIAGWDWDTQKLTEQEQPQLQAKNNLIIPPPRAAKNAS